MENSLFGGKTKENPNMENSLFCRKINVGDAIKPFLVSGVLEKEYTGSRNGGEMINFRESAIWEAVEKFKDTAFK